MADGSTGIGGNAGRGRQAGPRCVALVGPFASGKTSLLEAILERTGAIPKAGRVADGTSLGDAAPEARAHRMGVELNVADCEFLGERFTILDCPGSVEFLFEGEAVLPGVDMAVVVCEADQKKIPALQLTLKLLETRGVPHVLFLNKIDKADQSLRETLELMQTASTVPMVLRQIPIWKEGIAIGTIDLALERAHVFREHAESEIVPIPDADRAQEVEARYQMLEKLADYDDHLMEELLSDIEPPRDEIFEDLRRETREGLICPVFIGSAERGNGVTRLLKAIRHDAPSVAATADRLGLNAGPGEAVVQVMKTLHTQHGGKMSIARVLAGKLAEGATLFDPNGAGDRISGLYRIQGKETTKRGEAIAGETVGLAKVEVAHTGDTLTTAKTGTPRLATLTPPEPVMGTAVVPTDRKDEVKLNAALTRIAEEDPSIRISHDAETGETLVEGQGEMHLRVAFERLTAKFGVTVEFRPISVPYRETIRGKTSVRGRHKKQSGGHGQFGDVVLEIAPLPRGSGFVFTEAITGGVVPRNYIPAVEEGVADCLKAGALGFPVVDLAVRLVDGSYHTVDSSDMAFKTAAQIGMREGLPNCQPILLEPILRVEIACPSDATARINQIVTGRRGQLLGFDARIDWAGWDTVQALIPQAEMQHLIVELRSATAGVGTFRARFEHLAELSGHLAAKVLERQKAARAA
ncbi:elongation factor G [Prosthecomicrobium hirschii]|uniref:elongation factor G n=1 Tax=Prosthecodimorpha hirschii TaxID=665126 RepID=UPI0023EE5C35|nr:elongation factor G [Prosthecomicrobium hirschii]